MSKYKDNLLVAQGFIEDMNFYLRMAEMHAVTEERKNNVLRIKKSLDNIRGLIDEEVNKDELFTLNRDRIL